MKMQRRPVRRNLRLGSTEAEPEMEIIMQAIYSWSPLRRNLPTSEGSRIRHEEKLSKNVVSSKSSLSLVKTGWGI